MIAPDSEYLKNVWSNHVYPLARKMNMDLKPPPVQTRSRLAHEAAKWAGSHNRDHEYTLALFKAFFTDGLDIGDRNVLAGLADDLSLDSQDLLTALDKNTFTGEVIADETKAHQIGVNAVPAFVANNRILAQGVQTADTLQSLITGRPLYELF